MISDYWLNVCIVQLLFIINYEFVIICPINHNLQEIILNSLLHQAADKDLQRHYHHVSKLTNYKIPYSKKNIWWSMLAMTKWEVVERETVRQISSQCDSWNFSQLKRRSCSSTQFKSLLMFNDNLINYYYFSRDCRIIVKITFDK